MSAALYWAIMLARDIETCEALLLGDPVSRARLDPVWLNAAAELRLVRLDFTALDLFQPQLLEAAE